MNQIDILKIRLQRYEEELSEYTSLVNLRKSYIEHIKIQITELINEDIRTIIKEY